jgi:hypothetical protein
VQRVAVICKRTNSELIVRSKPSGAALGVLSAALGIQKERLAYWASLPMEEIVRQTSFCISYGETSSILSWFFTPYSKVVGYYPQQYPRNFWSDIDFDYDIVDSVDIITSMIDDFFSSFSKKSVSTQ